MSILYSCDGIDNDCVDSTGHCINCKEIFDSLAEEDRSDGNYIIDLDDNSEMTSGKWLYCTRSVENG